MRRARPAQRATRGAESGDDDAAHRHHHDLVEAVTEGDAERGSALVRSIFDPFMH